MEILAWCSDSENKGIESVELYCAGEPTGIILYKHDSVPSVYYRDDILFPAGMFKQEFLFELGIVDAHKTTSICWPYIVVE